MNGRMMRIALIPAVLAVAACGATEDAVDEVLTPSFGQLEAEGALLVEEWGGAPVTDPSDLPVAGGATYEGIMALDLGAIPTAPGDVADVMGEMTLDVDFDGLGDPVTGEVTNLVGADDRAFTGTLDISGGTLDLTADTDTAWTFGADVDGTVEDPDGEDWNIEGSLNGNFLGNDAEAAMGVVDGQACTAEDCSGMGGGFIVER